MNLSQLTIKFTTEWLPLSVAIVFGVMGTLTMKLSHGMRKAKPILLIAIFYTVSFVMLTFAMKYIELSVVYAVWSGVGTILVATIGIFYFGEYISIKKIFFLTLIVIGVIGIHLRDSLIKF